MQALAEIEPLRSFTLAEVMDVPPEKIEEVEAKLLKLPQIDYQLDHHFPPGAYLRTITMPAGSFVIGHKHLTEHANVVLTGRAAVMLDGKLHHIVAPCTFISKPGVRKVLYIFETMKWMTIHPTEETNLDKLEEMLIVKSASFMEHIEDLGKLQAISIGGAQ